MSNERKALLERVDAAVKSIGAETELQKLYCDMPTAKVQGCSHPCGHTRNLKTCLLDNKRGVYKYE